MYSLGATLYHALTGTVPPTATDRMANPRRFYPVRALNDRVSVATERVVLRSLELVRDNRFASAMEMAAALRGNKVPGSGKVNTRQQTQKMPGVPTAQPSQRWLRSAWIWVLGSAIVMITLIIGFNSLSRLTSSAPEPTPEGLTLIPRSPTVATGTFAKPTQTLAPTPTTTVEPTPTSTPVMLVAGDTRIRATDSMVMVYIPEGQFQMGSSGMDDLAVADERPTRQVFLDAYWIDRTEVTVGQYAECVAAGVCNRPREATSKTRSDYFTNEKYARYPVLWVTWYDASTYCRWVGARLPSEAEWERAARGPKGLIFPWGNDWEAGRTNAANRLGDTQAVGSFPDGASPDGVLDMSGNVWEWTQDWFSAEYYSTAPDRNPGGPTTGAKHSVRGGSWYSRIAWQRAAYRGASEPDFADDDIGFRCAMTAGVTP